MRLMSFRLDFVTPLHQPGYCDMGTLGAARARAANWKPFQKHLRHLAALNLAMTSDISKYVLCRAMSRIGGHIRRTAYIIQLVRRYTNLASRKELYTGHKPRTKPSHNV